MRTPKNRYTGLKYLSKMIPKQKNEEENEEEDDEEDDEDYEDDLEDEDEEEEEKSEIKNKNNIPTKILENHQTLESSERLVFEKNTETFLLSRSIVDSNIDSEECDRSECCNENFDDHKAKIKLKRELEEYNNKKFGEEIQHYPHKSTLVLNAILACLEDESPTVQKAVLEFMYSHLKLSMELFTDADKLLLVEAVLYLLIKKENTHDRRIYDWLFGKPNLDNKYEVEENNCVFKLIMEATARIFKTAPADEKAIPLKILQKLFIMNEGIVESTLRQLSLKILNYMYKYHEGFDFSSEFDKQCSKFFENIRSHFPLLLKSFFPPLDKALNEKKDKKCLKIIRLIQFTFNEIFIKKEANYLQIIACSEFMIMNILKVFHYFNAENGLLHYKFVVPAIELCLQLNECLEKKLQANKPMKCDEIDELEKENKDEKTQQFENSFKTNADILEGFSQVYGVIVKFQREKIDEKQDNDTTIDLFSLSSKILVKAQRFLRVDKLNNLPEWFYLIVECLNLNNQHVCIIAIETIIDILNFSKDESPENIYRELKNLIIEDSSIKRESHEFDYVKAIIEKLWTFLDYNAYQKKIVELILDFQRYFKEIFKEVTFQSLKLPSILDQEFAIRRFAVYWKLTNEEEFQKNIVQINDALFVMLDYLDHDNPIIRHTSKSWLMDSMNKLFRILDPIYETLINFKLEEIKEMKDSKIITEMFRRLKTILSISNEEALIYISKKNISLDLHNVVMKNEDGNLRNQNIYIDLLVVLCLKFIEGNQLKKDAVESSSVNASSCEFLEMIINLLDPKQTSQRICSIIIEPLLDVLDKAIENQIFVMQVQVLNLIKVILFHSGNFLIFLFIFLSINFFFVINL